MKVMNIHFICGLNGDRIKVNIKENDTDTFNKEYSYGYNASYSRENAADAERNRANAIKYGWNMNSGYYCLKPFIGDIINELVKTNNIAKDETTFSGHYVFGCKDFTEEEVNDFREEILSYID